MCMQAPISIVFLEHFQALEDPRQLTKVIYPLHEVLLLSLCAVISGAETFIDIADYGKEKEAFLKQLSPFKNGIPSHDTIGAIFSHLDPDGFQKCFVSWVSSLQKILPDIVSIDGKALCGAHNAGEPVLYMVSAWACRQRLVLGQEKVADKSNEITAVPKLLEMLMLKGAIVTLDAMGCQRTIAEGILEKEADYVLALKGNQGTLHDDVVQFFEQQLKEGFRHSRVDTLEKTEKSHGRLEFRRYTSTDDVDLLQERHNWPGLKSIVLVETRRSEHGKTQTEKRFYISSLPMDTERISEAIRSHWQVENCLHWVLDVVFLDDHCRVRKDNSPHIFHIVKQMALNLIKQVQDKKSIRRKRKSAGWNNQFLLQVLHGT